MKKIMLVDDEAHVLRILKNTLQKHGYQISTYPNGQAALDALANETPDVLITDIQMPRMTGEQLCKAIEQQMPAREFLIFVITSRTEVEHREWSAKIRNLQFVEKPISVRKLLVLLDEYFASRAGVGA
jgi:chemosensory pili system protein ChpA (sensor histidine kinase/response regulator)